MTHLRVLFSSTALVVACASPTPIAVPIDPPKRAECREASDCGAPAACETRSCDAGVCHRAPIAPGSPAAAQIVGDCKRAICDENGAAVITTDVADGPPDDANACTIERCETDKPVVDVAPLMTVCESDGVCARDRDCLHVASVAAAQSLVCAVERGTGEVTCQDEFDRVLRGPSTKRLEGVRGVALLGLHRTHACASFASGAVECWGLATELGLGGADANARVRSDRRLPIRGVTDVAELALTQSTTCARSKNGDVHCWGIRGSAPAVDAPEVRLVPGVHAIAIASSTQRTCAIDTSGQVFCWGLVDFVGSRSRSDQAPEAAPGFTDAIAVAVGDGMDCIIRKNGSVACRGRALRQGRPPRLVGAQTVAGLSSVTAIAVDDDGGCARTDAGRVSCFDGFEAPVVPHRLQGADRLSGSAGGIVFRLANGDFANTRVERVPLVVRW